MGLATSMVRARHGLILGIVLAASGAAHAAGYTYQMSITIDHTKVGGASGPATLTNFPFLFSSTNVKLKTTGNGGHVTDSQGDDILFRGFDTTTCGGPKNCALDHEVESYTASTGEFTAWVRLPSVNASGASTDTVINLYYGNASI